MTQNLATVLAILFLSNLVQSTFSFGGALVALPLLALVLDVRTATPLMTLLSFTIACLEWAANCEPARICGRIGALEYWRPCRLIVVRMDKGDDGNDEQPIAGLRNSQVGRRLLCFTVAVWFKERSQT